MCIVKPVPIEYFLSFGFTIQLQKVELKERKYMYHIVYCDIVQLVILFCNENLFNRSTAHAALLFPLCFSCLIKNERKHLAKNKKKENKKNKQSYNK